MKYFIILLILFTFLSVAHSQTIIQAEWFFAPDPGMGNGNPITASTPNDSVGLNFEVPVDTLSPGTYQVFLRNRSNNGNWGVPQLVKIFKIDMIPSLANNLNIDQVEYWTDSDPPTLDDVTDSSQVNISPISGVMILQGAGEWSKDDHFLRLIYWLSHYRLNQSQQWNIGRIAAHPRLMMLRIRRR